MPFRHQIRGLSFGLDPEGDPEAVLILQRRLFCHLIERFSFSEDKKGYTKEIV